MSVESFFAAHLKKLMPVAEKYCARKRMLLDMEKREDERLAKLVEKRWRRERMKAIKVNLDDL